VTIVTDRSAFGWIMAELASAVAKNDTQPMKSSPTYKEVEHWEERRGEQL